MSEHLESNRHAGQADGHRLLDVEAVAQRLGVGERFVRRLVFERRIAYVKVGRHVRFEPAVIDRWIDEARQEPAL